MGRFVEGSIRNSAGSGSLGLCEEVAALLFLLS